MFKRILAVMMFCFILQGVSFSEDVEIFEQFRGTYITYGLITFDNGNPIVRQIQEEMLFFMGKKMFAMNRNFYTIERVNTVEFEALSKDSVWYEFYFEELENPVTLLPLGKDDDGYDIYWMRVIKKDGKVTLILLYRQESR